MSRKPPIAAMTILAALMLALGGCVSTQENHALARSSSESKTIVTRDEFVQLLKQIDSRSAPPEAGELSRILDVGNVRAAAGSRSSFDYAAGSEANAFGLSGANLHLSGEAGKGDVVRRVAFTFDQGSPPEGTQCLIFDELAGALSLVVQPPVPTGYQGTEWRVSATKSTQSHEVYVSTTDVARPCVSSITIAFHGGS